MLLTLLLPEGIAGEAIRGDLEQEFHRRRRERSPGAARGWYRRQALGVVVRYRLRGLVTGATGGLGRRGRHDGSPPAWRGLADDLRHAVRRLGRAPGTTLLVVVALGVGIGVNTAAFSVVDAVLLEPLPFPEADRIVQVWETNPRAAAERRVAYRDFGVNALTFEAYRASTDAFTDLAHVGHYADPPGRITVGGGEGPTEVVHGMSVSHSFFRVLGVQPALGRGFTADELPPPDAWRWTEISIISHDLWTRRFGADPGLVGRTIQLDGAPSTVVGVLPPGFEFPPLSYRGRTIDPEVQVLLPLVYRAFDQPRTYRQFMVVGRLREGVTPAAAQADLERIAARLAASHPEAMEGWTPVVAPLPSIVARDFGTELRIVMATSALVLLVACINVANLLLAQGIHRRGELALRAALGGSRWRLRRLLLTESGLLALAGGLAGLILASAGTGALVSMIPADVPRVAQAGIDGPVLLFTLAVSLVTGLAFGLVPALRATGGRKGRGLLAGWGGGGRGPTRRQGASPLLVGVQVAVSLVLLVGAGLAAKSFLQLRSRDPGYDPENLIVAELRTGSHHRFFRIRWEDRERRHERWDAAVEMLQRIRRVPGVVSAAAGPIPTDQFWAGTLWLPRGPGSVPRDTVRAFEANVSPGYFETLGIPLLQGEPFPDWSAGDGDRYWWHIREDVCARSPGTCTAIVSQSFARRVWPGEDPIGKRLGSWGCCTTVVGVVGDVRIRGVDAPSLNAPLDEAFRVYFPYMELGPYLIRTAGPPEEWIEPLRRAIRSAYPEAALRLTTQEAELARSLARPRFYAAVGLLLAAVALVLATMGLYGVIAYSVGRRTREIGVRIALGADRTDVRTMVLRQGMGPVLVGSAVGILAAFALGRALAALLYGMSPADPWVAGGVWGLLLAVAAAACWVPARQASSVDPVEALSVD